MNYGEVAKINREKFEKAEALLREHPDMKTTEACDTIGISKQVFSYYRNYKPSTKKPRTTPRVIAPRVIDVAVKTLPTHKINDKAIVIIANGETLRNVLREFL